jgi:4-deoxy-L-threo-5-hexosulose-uronate ketol-isomerase
MASDYKTYRNSKNNANEIAIQTLEQKYSPAPEHVGFMNSSELRSSFLVEDLVLPGNPKLLGTDLDRLVVGAVVPQDAWTLPAFAELGTRSFHERRETGILNVGGKGTVIVDDTQYELNRLDCLYIGLGAENVVFCGLDNERAELPIYYLLSSPAHRAYPTIQARLEDASVQEIGDASRCSRRKLCQYIHDGGIQSCQLVMGFTEVPLGSVWNTMPCHVHSRRSEIYFYFDLEEQIVIHLMGEPQNTRHLIIRDRQAVLSPPWSIHCGAGTGSYRFAWGMAGENKRFNDMDPLSAGDLR